MRLWHKDLIPYLPRKQLLAQWRECCVICSNWANKGTPNHLLVNKVMDYSTMEFYYYCKLVRSEIENRGYKISKESICKFKDNFQKIHNNNIYSSNEFENWHNERYLKQCLFNLQEKYDCGGISEKEWEIIENKFGQYLKLNAELEKEVEELREYKRMNQPLYVDPMSL